MKSVIASIYRIQDRDSGKIYKRDNYVLYNHIRCNFIAWRNSGIITTGYLYDYLAELRKLLRVRSDI